MIHFHIIICCNHACCVFVYNADTQFSDYTLHMTYIYKHFAVYIIMKGIYNLQLYNFTIYVCTYAQIYIISMNDIVLVFSWTYLCLILISRQTPHTMPTIISSTPRAPATTPPRRRPAAVTLIESLFTG